MSLPILGVYLPGNRLVDCDICGFTYRFSEMRKIRGLVVCPADADEYPHPRDKAVTHRTEGKIRQVG